MLSMLSGDVNEVDDFGHKLPSMLIWRGKQGSFANFLEVMFHTFSASDFGKKLRNGVLYGKEVGGLTEVVEWTMEFLEHFKIHNARTKLARNCDGALGKEGCNRGVGGVLRDSEASDLQEVVALLKGVFTCFAFTPVEERQSSPLPCEPLTGQQEALIRAGLEMPGLDWTVDNFNC
ncbi:unnamed protein product [Prunus armeniaca]|uniref:Uncharacterized protein n=1 Tax=Prunus armeniaca TaxID=36596 RepID=A0A6J5WVS5_PRUAR|nr:unnamed protein product [Prunus armeniaca]